MSIFPVNSLKDAAPHLRRPFSAGAIGFKVQTTSGSKGMCVAHLNARLVTERLNAIAPHLWFDSYERLDGKLLLCRLTIDGITREDVGEAGTMGKAIYSDAFKRAAVKFGIGVSLYALPRIWLDVGTNKGQLKKVTRGNKDSVHITPDAETHLRNLYGAWLDTDAGKSFGEPLDHGDPKEGSVGELVDSVPPHETDDSPAEDFDPKLAETQISRIHELHSKLPRANGKGSLTRGKLDAMVASNRESNSQLDKVIEHLQDLTKKEAGV